MDEVFRILGTIRVRMGGKLVEGSARHWRVLGVLLAHPGERIPFTSLIDWAWPTDQERPLNRAQTFHTYARRIRLLLEDIGTTAQLIGRNGTLRLEIDKSLIDYHSFRMMMDEARAADQDGDRRRARDRATAALDLWAGQPLAELDSVPVTNWRRKAVEDRWIPANVFLIGQHLALDELDEAMIRIEDTRELAPNNVALVKQRITVLRRLQRNEEATECYFDLRRYFRGNSDDDAADALRQFYEEVCATTGPAAESTVVTDPATERRPALLRVPHAAPDLIGRDDLLAELDASATDSAGRLRAGVLVLDGTPGVGKTALAVCWARRRHELHGDGALLINMHGFGSTPPIEADSAVDELLHSLDYQVDRIVTARGRAAKLRELVSGRPMMVVLDNVRDLGPVLPLLPLLSASLILITSRHHLAPLEISYGIRSITVPRLLPDDAARLITGRIGERAARDRDAVDSLVGLSSGLPIGLNIIASQISPRRGVPLVEFVERFRDRNVLLAAGRDGDGMDGSLQATFRMSYDVLRDPEQRLFRLLGLHFGPDISPEAAAALAGLSLVDCRRLLDNLVDSHLLEQRDALDRYRFHDLLQAFAAHVVETEESNEERRTAERRLLDFYLFSTYHADRQVFAYCEGPPMPPLPDDVVPMTFSDSRTAVDWCLTERRTLSEAVRRAAEDSFPAHGWLLPHAMHGIFKRCGLLQEIRAALTVAVDQARVASEDEAQGASIHDLGLLLLKLGEMDEARRLFYLATFFAKSTQSTEGLTSSLHNMGKLEVAEGNIQAGIELHEEALALAVASGDVIRQAGVMHELGGIFRSRKQFEKSITYYHSAVHLRLSVGHENGHVASLAELAMTYVQRGLSDDYLVAKQYAIQAVDAIPSPADTEVAQRARLVFASVLLRLGKGDEAVSEARAAVVLAVRDRSAIREGQAQRVLGDGLRMAGLRVEAVEAYRRCLAICRDCGDDQEADRIEALLEDLASTPDDLPEARSRSQRPADEGNHPVF